MCSEGLMHITCKFYMKRTLYRVTVNKFVKCIFLAYLWFDDILDFYDINELFLLLRMPEQYFHDSVRIKIIHIILPTLTKKYPIQLLR